ncbi:MAG: transcription antitermination factor NusB [Oscillospiraceae bacterium]|jgi:N utilization substance protein B|nr:transcription antitermination factor NusB [Oscillospiraceae bacterium]
MTRTGTRELAVRLIFSLSENGHSADEVVDEVLSDDYYPTLFGEDELYKSTPRGEETEYLRRVVTGVASRAAELDERIGKYALGWQVYRISRTAVAIMRIAMFETLYMPEIPPRSALDAAIDLAKKYETQETASFINGILGAFSREELSIETEDEDEAIPKRGGV